MFSILERIPDAVSFLSRFSLSILSPFPDDLLNLVRRRVALRVPLPLQRLILLLNRFRRLLAQAHSGRGVAAGSGGAAHEQPFVYGIPQNLGRLPSCLFANLYYLVIVFRILAE